MATVARVLGKRLREAGVRYAFGHPGGEVVELIEAFRQEGIEFILTRHENGAAFMANAYGQVAGTPGVCIATLGPGATNMVTGVAHAYLDRAPVLAITAQLSMDRYATFTHQRLDLLQLYAPVTKGQFLVSPGNVHAVAERALRLAMEERPGPVYLQVPSDWAVADAKFVTYPVTHTSIRGGAVSAEELKDIAHQILAARKPLLLAGFTALRRDAHEALRAFAEHFALPVIVGPKSKGVFPESHPLFVGTIEMLGTGVLFDAIADADLVVMVGFDAVELDRDWDFDVPVVSIDTVPNDQCVPVNVEVVGSIDSILDGLCRAAPAEVRDRRQVALALRERLSKTIGPKETAGLSPQEVISILREALPTEGRLTVGVGAHKMAAGQVWRTDQPHTFFMSNGLSSMGYAFPAALALKLVDPRRPVACLVGDGDFAMSLGELETAVRQELAVAVVVLVDGALRLIELSQERRGYPSTGTRFGNPSFADLARSFGAHGFRAETAAQCREAFAEALASQTPTVVEVPIDGRAYNVG